MLGELLWRENCYLDLLYGVMAVVFLQCMLQRFT